MRVHSAVKIDHGCVVYVTFCFINRPLVMCQACRVICLDPTSCFLKRISVTGLVPKRPDQDTGCIFYPALHSAPRGLLLPYQTSDPLPAYKKSFLKSPHKKKLLRASQYPAFCRSHKNRSVTVLRKPRCIGIMAGADRINIMRFHQFEVFLQLFPAYGIACLCIAVMAVHTAYLDRSPI